MQQINDNFDLQAAKPVDHRTMLLSGLNYVVYSSVAEANTNIEISVRHQTLMVPINTVDGIKLYWYKNGIEDIDLIEFVPSFEVTSFGIPYKFKVVGLADLSIESGEYYFDWTLVNHSSTRVFRLLDPVGITGIIKYFRLPNPADVPDNTIIEVGFGGGSWILTYNILNSEDGGLILPLNNSISPTQQYPFTEKGWYQYCKNGNTWYQTAFARVSTSESLVRSYQILIKGETPVTVLSNVEWVGATWLYGTRSGAPIYIVDPEDPDTAGFDVFDSVSGSFIPAVALEPSNNEIVVIVLKTFEG